MTLHSFWDQYPAIKEDLTDIKTTIQKKVFVRNDEINAAIKDVFQSNGKMIRPAYSLFFSKLGPESQTQRARDLASAIEVFHNATLIHDDIIDDGRVRRGKATIQSKYGKKAAVYAGDYLISVCFKMTHPYRETIDTQGLLTRAMERVIKGELHQLDQSFNTMITLRQYLTQIQGKTAELFGLSCMNGAIESQMSIKDQNLSYRIGVQIGMAFQLMDDLLEYTQEEADWEKSFMQDITNGVYTAPLIIAFKRTPQFFEKILKKGDLSASDVEDIRRVLVETDAIAETFELAEKYTSKALELISRLPKSEEQQDIEKLTKVLLNRKT